MIIILDNIRSLYNVGSIFRTADGAGVEKIYICGITSTPLDKLGEFRPQISKVSLGAEKSVKWEYVKSTNLLINRLRKEKYKIFAVELDKKSVPYFKIKLKKSDLEKTAFVFGHEVRGISKSILKKSDKVLEIPMHGKKESLNVSIAVGIILFYFKEGIKRLK
ncbi:TrmH family RNA methyltransferase [Patescibacteria group bacterium]|nr:TrmH family RNA methyltransferase [Patescibacteria group bacterium]